MNDLVECILDGAYWNIPKGDSRSRHTRAIQKVFTYDENHMKLKTPTGKSKPMTPEQKEKAKKRSDQQRVIHRERVTVEHTRNVKKQKKINEGVSAFKGILVGSSKVAKNYDLLRENDIKCIVNVTSSVKNYFEDKPELNLTYKKISIEDGDDVRISDHFEDCYSFIEQALENGNVLIHCKLGQSRSPTIAISFAMKYYNLKLSEAYEKYISEAGKDHVKINNGFKRQLMQWDMHLYGGTEPSLDLLKRELKDDAMFISKDDSVGYTFCNNIDVTYHSEYEYSVSEYVDSPKKSSKNKGKSSSKNKKEKADEFNEFFGNGSATKKKLEFDMNEEDDGASLKKREKKEKKEKKEKDRVEKAAKKQKKDEKERKKESSKSGTEEKKEKEIKKSINKDHMESEKSFDNENLKMKEPKKVGKNGSKEVATVKSGEKGSNKRKRSELEDYVLALQQQSNAMRTHMAQMNKHIESLEGRLLMSEKKLTEVESFQVKYLASLKKIKL